jgi:hypothetical protein
MVYPILCSDEYGLEGVKDAEQFIQWFNSWLQEAGTTKCTIEKVSVLGGNEVQSYLIRLPQG